ncbi:MAG: 16S rRNA (cytosine(967)-C(5))-methyltransferase RsmB [Candidatus Saccharibacteria bacterium]
MTNNNVKKDISARALAAQVLVQIFYQGSYANLALDKALNSSQLQPADRGLVTELVNGTVRMKKHLDWVLKLFLARNRGLKGRVYAVIVMTIYQLLFLDKIPAYAAINEAVNMVKKDGQGISGMVNGVLRNIERNKGKFEYPDPIKNAVENLAVYYSHPEWMVERWLSRYGQAGTVMLLEFNNSVAPLAIRTNTLKTTREELIEHLQSESVACHAGSIHPQCIIIDSLPQPIFRLENYRQGLFYIQSEATMLIPSTLQPSPGQSLYDVCCGVGGKSSHLAEIMHNQGKITAIDLYKKKLDLLSRNCGRLGINIVRPRETDVLNVMLPQESAHSILLDAPCSGLGVLRSRADMRWRRQEEDIEELAGMQQEMLERIAPAVKKGGYCLYSTCTLEPEETDKVIEEFLGRHGEFEPLDITEALNFFPYSDADRQTAVNGRLSVFPPVYGVDGMYISLMRRKNIG